MRTYTISEAQRLLADHGHAISIDALRKRVQKPDSPTGLRSVLNSDGKRRIPRSELERLFSLDGATEDQKDVIQHLTDRLLEQEREITSLKALPARLEADATEQREAAKAAASRAAQAEALASELERKLEGIASAKWIHRRKLIRSLSVLSTSTTDK
jgi:glycine cleavage system regulatory protein